MNLVASLIVKDELERYLSLAVAHLQAFCDELRVLDDNSTDGSYEWLLEQERVSVISNDRLSFFEHEGVARQRLLEHTMEAQPTHVLAIDADEFVADGQGMRTALERPSEVWSLVMEEVWKADAKGLHIRMDGGWRPHPVPILYAVPSQTDREWRARKRHWQIPYRQLACGREPEAIRRIAGRAKPAGNILHFGWVDEVNRQARYDRYAVHDGGRFHRSSHLQSILWPDSLVQLEPRPWPPALKELMAVMV